VTRFLDTNVLVYARGDSRNAGVAQDIIAEGGEISVQVLNEFAHVLRRKLRRSWADIEMALADVAIVLPPPRPLTHATHKMAMMISRESGYAVYDALIVASALEAGCDELVTEDMQHGQTVGGLTIRNPFIVN
jgi:predicted nucleic acid-binding protein